MTKASNPNHNSGRSLEGRQPVVQRVDWVTALKGFQPGDKIYGVSEYYRKAYEAIEKSFKKAGKGDASLSVTASVWDFIRILVPDEESNEIEDPITDDQKAFKAWFAGSGYATKLEHLRKAPGTSTTQIQVVCKAALTFVAQRTRKIHFILGGLLDKLKMRGITGVDTPAWPKTKHGLHGSTTAKELRKVYKEWPTLKDSVIFYDGEGNRIGAPWVEGYTAEWEHYAKQRQIRREGKK